MSRTPARFTQADVRRALRAAKQEGGGDVTVLPDGSIVIRVAETRISGPKELDEERIIPL